MRFRWSNAEEDRATQTHAILLHPFWASPEYSLRWESLKRSWPEMANIAKEAFAVGILERIRMKFPSLMLIARDGNVDSTIPSRLDLRELGLKRVVVQGPTESRKPSGDIRTAPYLLLQSRVEETLELWAGLGNEDSMAIYLYCFTKVPIGFEKVAESLRISSNWENFLRGLANVCDVIASPGPDAYYVELRSRNEPILRELAATGP